MFETTWTQTNIAGCSIFKASKMLSSSSTRDTKRFVAKFLSYAMTFVTDMMHSWRGLMNATTQH